MTPADIDCLLRPIGARVFERGWLSANNILLTDPQGHGPNVLVDSGYCTHAPQTVALVEQALAQQPLHQLLNTHLHSDHCGGNAALQNRYPALETWVPAGEWNSVQTWDEVRLSYLATGQRCPRFVANHTLAAGQSLTLGCARWQVHAAPGHDPHSVVLFQPEHRVLISADALWENGFGVVFPELDGENAFEDVARTLDLIERLAPRLVIAGHGGMFWDVGAALAKARRRLDGFVLDPMRHARHAAKVLIKFKLLEWGQTSWMDLLDWFHLTPYLQHLHQRLGCGMSAGHWLTQTLDDLVNGGAAAIVHKGQDIWIENR